MRRCAACRSSAAKRELLRFVRAAGRFAYDPTQRAAGRGTSICQACANALLAGGDRNRLRGLQRTFGAEMSAVAAELERHHGAQHAAPAPAHQSAFMNGGVHG